MHSVIRESLVHDIVGQSKGELLPTERLYVAHSSGLIESINKRWLVDLYMECGCISGASEIYQELAHWRKLGDLAWFHNDLDLAVEYYSRPENSEAFVFRPGPDWDRLIKLSFYRGRWEDVVHLTKVAPISPGFQEMRIMLSNSEVPAKPYLEILATALAQAQGVKKVDNFFNHQIIDKFGISLDDWANLLRAAQAPDNERLESIRKRCRPRFPFKQDVGRHVAMKIGRTARAVRLKEFLNHADEMVSSIKELIKAYITSGSKTNLKKLVSIINQTQIQSVSKTLFFAALENNSLDRSRVPPQRLVQLYACHPVLRRQYFGDYLSAKILAHIPFSGEDFLTGLFQRMSLVDYRTVPKDDEGTLDFRRLSSWRDWAVSELDTWCKEDGRWEIERLYHTWLNAQEAAHHSDPKIRYSIPASPRDSKEWDNCLNHCLIWLTSRWDSSIGISQWKSEEALFQLLKKAFSGCEVLQHAQPIWLESQHLDVFIPDLSLAIEYMGLQHYEPVEFFGGLEGFNQTVERDKKKAKLCLKCGIKLVYVKYNEDISRRAAEITKEFASWRRSGVSIHVPKGNKKCFS